MFSHGLVFKSSFFRDYRLGPLNSDSGSLRTGSGSYGVPRREEATLQGSADCSSAYRLTLRRFGAERRRWTFRLTVKGTASSPSYGGVAVVGSARRWKSIGCYKCGGQRTTLGISSILSRRSQASNMGQLLRLGSLYLKSHLTAQKRFLL